MLTLSVLSRLVPRPSGVDHATGLAGLAALALVAIQVGIGIILKTSQSQDGKYAFSTSASITISEFFKLVLSAIFFYNECRQRAAKGISPSARGLGAEQHKYAAVPGRELREDQEAGGDGQSVDMLQKDAEVGMTVEMGGQRDKAPWLPLTAYWAYVRGEVPGDLRYGFCRLALFYVMINNLIFVLYRAADPGTVQLVRSGVTFITALVMRATLKSQISKVQWIAIVMQICGLITTQYHPENGTTYPIQTYIFILFQTFLSASSGVYNQALLKSDKCSLHADNMVLYAAGTVFNLLSHLTVRMLKEDEPGFFTGYGNFNACMVIVSNVFMGLAITAVYKYADAVIKCLATAVATGILLYLTPILFQTELGFLVVPGTVVIFISSWLYVDNPAPKNATSEPSAVANNPPQKPSLFEKLMAMAQAYQGVVLGVLTFLTVIFVAFVAMLDGGVYTQMRPGTSTINDANSLVVQSPFRNALAFIRANGHHPERIPTLMKYDPFFHTTHISMPKLLPLKPTDFHNLTHDQFESGILVYQQVAQTMRLLLLQQPDIEGVMYFHFDAWLHPLRFSDLSPYDIWFMTSFHLGDGFGPVYRCTNDSSRYPWKWGWFPKNKDGAMGALDALAQLDALQYDIVPGEICVGWADIFYIPRRFFADFVMLAEVFSAYKVMGEIAVPMMLTILDRSRRRSPEIPVMRLLMDCWGSCCASHPAKDDIMLHRCGHKIDYRNDNEVRTVMQSLDRQVALLGQPLQSTKYPFGPDFDDEAFKKMYSKVMGVESDEKLSKAAKDQPVADEDVEAWTREALKAAQEDLPVR